MHRERCVACSENFIDELVRFVTSLQLFNSPVPQADYEDKNASFRFLSSIERFGFFNSSEVNLVFACTYTKKKKLFIMSKRGKFSLSNTYVLL